jgi:hypothetical protein
VVGFEFVTKDTLYVILKAIDEEIIYKTLFSYETSFEGNHISVQITDFEPRRLTPELRKETSCPSGMVKKTSQSREFDIIQRVGELGLIIRSLSSVKILYHRKNDSFTLQSEFLVGTRNEVPGFKGPYIHTDAILFHKGLELVTPFNSQPYTCSPTVDPSGNIFFL